MHVSPASMARYIPAQPTPREVAPVSHRPRFSGANAAPESPAHAIFNIGAALALGALAIYEARGKKQPVEAAPKAHKPLNILA